MHKWNDTFSDGHVVVFDEVLYETKVQLDLNFEVALIESPDEAGKVWLKSRHQVFVADDGV